MKLKFPAIAFFVSLFALIGLCGLIYSTKQVTPPNVIEGTTANFEAQVLNSPIPVYVEFYVGGGQCKPCEAEAPIVAKLATEYAGKVRFVRVDANKEPAIAQAAGLTHVPAHFFLKPAEGVGGSVKGFLDEAQLRQFIEAGLKLQAPPANGGNGGNGVAPDNGNGNDAPAAPAEDKKDGQ